METLQMAPGAIITGTVVEIGGDSVVVHAGLKSEGFIPKSEFVDETGAFELAIGDQVKVAMEVVDDGEGETRLSREKARRAETWLMLEQAYGSGDPVRGVISGKVKAASPWISATSGPSCPVPWWISAPCGKPPIWKAGPWNSASSSSIRSATTWSSPGAPCWNRKNSEEREALLASLEEGLDLKGVVKNLTDYGAFVDLGGVDGLLHITDMAWRRIRHPNEVGRSGG